jgi:glycosyltransferase involved in cell wall biosynthesis
MGVAEAVVTARLAGSGEQRRTIHHFGPDPAFAGGIGSVIRVLTEHKMGGCSVYAHPTWRPTASLASLPLATASATWIPRVGACDVIHVHLAENGAFVREGAIVAAARALAKNTVVTIHGAEFLPFAHKHPRVAASVLNCADLITCLDDAVLRHVRAITTNSEVELLANPVAIDDRSSPADRTEEIVLFAGEIGVRKGADVLLRAWPEVARARPDARCILVGPTRDFDVPETERLEVLGPVDAPAMRALIRSARVVALPSRAEGMPMILTEAMAAGRPFVSTPVGGIPELAQAGGILVAVGDEVELARRLIELLADARLARTVGEQGQRHCRRTRSVPIIDARLRELYDRVSGRRSS